MCFGSLDFIVTTDGALERIQATPHPDGLDAVNRALRGLQLHLQKDDTLSDPQNRGFDSARLGCQLQLLLGPRSTQEDLCCVVFVFTNVVTQLAEGEPLSPNIMTECTMMAYPFGLKNATVHASHHAASRNAMHPTNDEFVGMADYVSESVFDLMAERSTLGSSSYSSGESHHPSQECYMADTPGGSHGKHYGFPRLPA